MTESEPDWPGLGTQAGPDPLAERLLAARRALTARDIDPDVRTRLHLRLMAICTSLKMPAADRARGAHRLDRLISDAERARCGAGVDPDPVRRVTKTDPGEGTGR